MSLQLDDSFIIADHIREKVEEYIEEKKVLDNKAFIWIDCNSLEVYISNTDEEHTGIKIPISDFYPGRERKSYSRLRSDRVLCSYFGLNSFIASRVFEADLSCFIFPQG